MSGLPCDIDLSMVTDPDELRCINHPAVVEAGMMSEALWSYRQARECGDDHDGAMWFAICEWDL